MIFDRYSKDFAGYMYKEQKKQELKEVMYEVGRFVLGLAVLYFIAMMLFVFGG